MIRKNYSLGIDWEDFGLISYDKGKIKEYNCFRNDFIDETYYLLEFLKRRGVYSTFFVNARTAEAYTELVKVINEYGHKIGSHGYKHVSRQSLSKKEFLDDCIYSKKVIEDIVQKEVIGYRSPLLSISKSDYLDSLDILNEAGYHYDSSITLKELKKISSDKQRVPIKIIPLTSLNLGLVSFNLAGGSTWRIFPSFLTTSILKSRFTSNNTSFYLHPYEFGKNINPGRAIGSNSNPILRFLIGLRWNLNKSAIEKILSNLATSSTVKISEVPEK